jgi:hypothetical protein
MRVASFELLGLSGGEEINGIAFKLTKALNFGV